jgi:S-adenosylmethionine hydrolase
MPRSATTRPDASPPVISFLSDYGHLDAFVGICHGVIARRCPGARVIDLSHAIPRHDVHTGARVLRAALPYLPDGVHLAVVDPGVGSDARRAVALRTAERDRLLVGPDNGLLMPAAEQLAGVIEAVDIGRSRERLEPVSHTFHGRDIFAPVAAALAAGATLSDVGDPLAAEELRRLELSSARVSDGVLEAQVLRCDGFGNVILDATAEQLEALGLRLGDALTVRHAGRAHTACLASTFADVPFGQLLLYVDAQRMVALAVNRGSAAELLGAGREDAILVVAG